jgi:hypothetical protein
VVVVLYTAVVLIRAAAKSVPEGSQEAPVTV